LETEEQSLEREQNERDVLEALRDYKCDTGMSVENGPAVVNIKTLKGRFIASSLLGGVGGGCSEECGKGKRVLLASLQSSISQKRNAGLKN